MQHLPFKLHASYSPAGDQPLAIKEICETFAKPTDRSPEGSRSKNAHVLLGVTGSGKTFTMANVIANLGRPTIVIAPNKTLAAQLFMEFKELFPENSVEYFISYYDYYQPEAYVPTTDTYIAKDSSINDDIDKMRHSATMSLLERRDVIIVASVSCIFGLGSPDSYAKLVLNIKAGDELPRNKFLRGLVNIQYSRNDRSLVRGCFRVRGDVIDILPSHQRDEAVRVEFLHDAIEKISLIDALTGRTLREVDSLSFYPNSHYVTDQTDMQITIREILTDLGVRLREFKDQGKLVEYQRLEQRTMHDVELLEQIGFCSGIENYTRYLTRTPPGDPPPTLLDYFPKDFLTIIDESHITVPQLGAMYRGNLSRKQVLVDFGFRLPSALDNRPLNFNEFLGRTGHVLYVSATPAPYELEICKGRIADQVIRPTGLVDPEIEVRPAKNQVDDLYGAMKKTIDCKGRVLVTTLTKRMAEEIAQYYREMGFRIRYLHSDIDSLERVELLRELRKGTFDVLVGINLLREGLDLPEVCLVAVMDADQEGFLRSRSSLIQVVGRAARNASGRVIFYGDKITDSMKACIDETSRRRMKQLAYNQEHNITPQTIIKALPKDIRTIYGLGEESAAEGAGKGGIFSEGLLSAMDQLKKKDVDSLDKLIRKKTKEMQKAAGELEFEKAALIRDEIAKLRELLMTFGDMRGPE